MKIQIVTRKERWGLSGIGWILVIAIVILTPCVLAVTIYPFLAVTQRVNTDVLVVEGWVNEFGIRASVEEYKTGRYHSIFTTGGPRPGALSDSDTAAATMADWLHYRGIPNEFLHSVPSHEVGRDRTFHAAVALRDWLRQHKSEIRNMNVVTEMAHARRTRLLYREAFGDNVAIGIIAAQNQDYDPKRWWCSSDGVRDVIGEAVAYTYAKLFFYPTNKGSKVARKAPE